MWLIVGVVALLLAGCSAVQEAVGVSNPELATDVTVRDAQGADVKCVWSSKLRVVSCPALSKQGKESATEGVAPSEVSTPPGPPPGGE